MVIDDLDVIGVAVLEAETQTPLVVYPNTPLPTPVSPEGLQSVRRRDAQVINAAGDVEHLKFSLRHRSKSAKPFRRRAAKQRLRVLAAEGLDHLERV